MSKRYPDNRRSNWHRPPYGTRRGSARSGGIKDYLLLFSVVMLVGWSAPPIVQRLWNNATLSPAEIKRIEQSVYYRGCDDARAAGAAPIYAGSPGYREGMDGDGDGIACEPYH